MKAVGAFNVKTILDQDKYLGVEQMDAVTITPCSFDGTDKDIFEYFDEQQSGHQEPIHAYPSGRVPLVPLKINDNTNKDFRNEKVKISCSSSPESGSWLSKTFCVRPSNSTLDTVEEFSSDEIARKMSFDQHHVCYVSDEGSMIDEDETTDGSTEYRNSFYHGNDYDCDLNLSIPQSPPIAFNSGQQQLEQQLDETFDYVVQSNLICNTWQNWYDDEEVKRRKPSMQTSLKVLTASHPYNSSRRPSKKKKRMQFLRSNLEPFGVNDLEVNFASPAFENPIELKKTSTSFSQSKSFQPFEAQGKKKRKSEEDCDWHASIIACGTLGHAEQEIEIVATREFETENEEYNEELCYDSDPCEMMTSIRREKKSTSRPVNRPRIYEDQTNEGDLDDDTSLEIIAEHMTAKRLLVWHKDTTLKPTVTSIAVHAWIEHGTQLHSALVQPKLCWREVYTKDCKSKGELQTVFTFHAVDLLDISKIIPMNEVLDRSKHPFVKRRSSFLVEAFGGCQEMIFEARDEAERDDIVEGLKLVVSRLGSKIMVGDSSVLTEFFTPLGSVPGNIPTIITGEIDG